MVSRRSAVSGAVVLRLALALAVLAMVCVAVVALLVRPDGGGDDAGPTTGAASAVPPPSGPGLTLQPPPPAPKVLPASTGGPTVSLARLRKQLAPTLAQPALGSHLGFVVGQLDRPGFRWSYGAGSAVPASTLKLLTTTAALSVLGPDHRFSTSVVQGSSRRSLVLVGGGDPLLAATSPASDEASAAYPQPASLEALATATAAKLRDEGVRRVRLGYDASLFTGPAVNPHWPSTYVEDSVVSPISALWVNEGRVTPGLAQRSADPAHAAAEAFRTQLGKAGMKVVGDLAEQRPPRPGGVPLAQVRSAPLAQVVQHILEVSDNEGAEVLLRQVALGRGKPGSSAAGVSVVRSTLTRLGIDVRDARIYDGSGLSRDDLLPLPLLLDVLRTASDVRHPELRGVMTGLPVAGFSGSLGDRFEGAADAGQGYVRAKTGTLTGVHALAGIAVTRAGQVLYFAVIADRVPAGTSPLDAEADLDRIAAALSTCTC